MSTNDGDGPIARIRMEDLYKKMTELQVEVMQLKSLIYMLVPPGNNPNNVQQDFLNGDWTVHAPVDSAGPYKVDNTFTTYQSLYRNGGKS